MIVDVWIWDGGSWFVLGVIVAGGDNFFAVWMQLEVYSNVFVA